MRYLKSIARTLAVLVVLAACTLAGWRAALEYEWRTNHPELHEIDCYAYENENTSVTIQTRRYNGVDGHTRITHLTCNGAGEAPVTVNLYNMDAKRSY